MRLGDGGQGEKERIVHSYTHPKVVINAVRFENCGVRSGDAEVPATENLLTEDVRHISFGFDECPTIRPCCTVTSPEHH
jgi:hypothetical protein